MISGFSKDRSQGSISSEPVVSIVVVTYESAATLPALWMSLRRELIGVHTSELLLVDNASSDDSIWFLNKIAMDAHAELKNFVLRTEIVSNPQNIGFGRACNLALRNARGRFLLLLNPDIEIEPGSLARAIAYFEAHSDIGILGPRVRLPSGRLDAPCRRSFKTPAIYFYKLSGLSSLFPRSPRFGRYYLSFLDEAVTTDVDAVIGAFMLLRRELVQQIGVMDERFFMYCEDEDLCFRAKQAGWRIVYYPESVVWHRKGASAAKRPVRMVLEWHRSIFQFHRKNLAARCAWWINALVYAGMATSATLGGAKATARMLRMARK